jgi:hypothetical protein
VIVDLFEQRAEVRQLDDFSQFYVRVAQDVKDIERAIQRSGAGWGVSDDEVFVDIDWLRKASGKADLADWNAGLDAMLTIADSFGWLDESGTGIRAHIEHANVRPHGKGLDSDPTE